MATIFNGTTVKEIGEDLNYKEYNRTYIGSVRYTGFGQCGNNNNNS